MPVAVQPASPIRSDSPVSETALDAIRQLAPDNGEEFLKSIIEMYLNNTRSTLEMLEKAWLNGDIESIRSLSHMLKSSSSQIGAFGLAESCLTVETAARNHQYDQTGKSLLDIQNTFTDVQKFLQSYLDD